MPSCINSSRWTRATLRPRSFSDAKSPAAWARISRAKPNLAGNPELLAVVLDDLDEEAGVRAALVELAGRMQVARAEPVRDHAAGLGASLVGEHPTFSIAVGVGFTNAWMQT